MAISDVDNFLRLCRAYLEAPTMERIVRVDEALTSLWIAHEGRPPQPSSATRRKEEEEPLLRLLLGVLKAKKDHTLNYLRALVLAAEEFLAQGVAKSRTLAYVQKRANEHGADFFQTVRAQECARRAAEGRSVYAFLADAVKEARPSLEETKSDRAELLHASYAAASRLYGR